MQELDLYEYAVIQLVPRVERGEYMNVGLVMFCKRKHWVKMDYHLNGVLFEAFCPEVEKGMVVNHLKAFQEIALGENKHSAIAQLSVAERFRWLTAVRSSIIQTSRPHSGKSKDLETTFSKIFKDFVL